MLRLLLILLTLTPICAFSQNTWTQKDSVNGAPRSVSSSFILNDEAYIIAGLDENGFRRKMYSYNFLQDDWDQEESIGGANGGGLNRGSACAFSIGLKAYVCLGQGDTNPFFKDHWEYDLVTQSWSQKADFIGEARRQACSFVINDLAYVGTGISASGLKKDMYRYNPSTNTWTQMSDFPGTARKEAASFTMAGQGYIATGDDGVMRNDFWQFEPVSGAWTQRTSMPGLPRKGAVGWGIFPNAYICAGEDNSFNYSTDLWEYNYWLNTWTQQPSLPGPGRSNAIAFVLNGLGFVGTGYNGVFLDDMYAFTPTLSTGVLLNDTDVSVYPIPATYRVTIDVKNEDVDIVLRSIDGKLLNNDEYSVKTNSGFIVNRKDLSAGTYFFQLTLEGNPVYSNKIVFN